MNKYNHQKIEKKWQRYWEVKKVFKTNDKAKGKKKYILDMFPYPSGAGLHVGHPEGYTATDIMSRYSRMNGFNVLHPMGWDAFGLPAENYAIKMGVHPQKTTQKNIKRFTQQIKSIGLSYDWSREVNTSNPEYYKWTQWLFLQFYKKGLAYKKLAAVNWCPKDNTVLANEQVVDGKCERCGSEVVQKKLSQWFFKITDYVEELLSDLDKLDWPEPIKLMQRNWIGKSMGAEIDFSVIASAAEAIPPKEKIASPLALLAMTAARNPNYVLLHGFKGNVDGIFFPWLKLSLEKKGYKSQAPNLPNSTSPTEDEQVNFVLNNCKFNENTVLFGHSLGAVVAMKVVEKLPHKIAGLVLAGGFVEPKFRDHRRPYENKFNWQFDFAKIKNQCGFIKILSDPTDFAVPLEQGQNLKEKLAGELIEQNGQKPHFMDLEEPVILQALAPYIKVFTTRPDTLFSGTFLVLAPDHPLVQSLTTTKQKAEIEKYILEASKKSEIERTALEKEKTGVFTGSYAINPASNDIMPIWVADFVLSNYGTGAVFADAHDERDFIFAKKYNLPLKTTIKPIDGSDNSKIRSLEICFSEKGVLYDSGEFSGLTSEVAILKIGEKFGKLKTQYKIRDWLISRQRYWGAPIPIIYCKACGEQPVPEKDLPVKLPTDIDFRPTGESPLKHSKKFSKVVCPKCGGKAERDFDTMDTFVDSAWYFLRYTDNNNKKVFAQLKKMQTWAPVNMYVGGAEHAVLHLLYARFFTKVLRDLGYLNFGEPFLALKNQGLILGPDGEKMSKSRGNVVNPDDVIKQSGADSLRMYEMFMGPFEDAKPWQTNGIVGVRRFLERVWNWTLERSVPIHGRGKKSDADKSARYMGSDKALRELHKLIKKVTEDIEGFHFNTSISAFMQFYNDIKDEPVSKEYIKTFLILLYPFAPHITEELNLMLGGKKSLQFEKWPKFDPALVIDNEIEVIVQVNGKIKGKITIARGATEYQVKTSAMQIDGVKQAIGAIEIKRVINVPNRLINFVI